MVSLKLWWCLLLCGWCDRGEAGVRRPEENDEVLRALGGARGGNLAAVCVRGVEPCAAALWRASWAVLRASCLARLPPARPLRVLRLADRITCAHLDAGQKTWVARSVELQRAHPGWLGSAGAPHDLALLRLDRPYEPYEALANVSDALYQLQDVSPWMEVEFLGWRARRARVARALRPDRSSADNLRLVGWCLMVPGVLFLLTFVVVTRCTGRRVRVPYANITSPPHRTSWNEYAYYNDKVNSSTYS